jgi:hypothetical protein
MKLEVLLKIQKINNLKKKINQIIVLNATPNTAPEAIYKINHQDFVYL